MKCGWLLSLWLACSLSAGAQTLWDLQGQRQELKDLLTPAQTKAAVLVIWCSQCGSCRQAEGEIETYAREYGPQVRVVAVTPHPADTPERVLTFLKEKSSELEVMRDPSQTLLQGYKIDRTTTALVYDKEAKLRYVGPFQDEETKLAVKDVLDGRRPEVSRRPLRGCPIPSL